MRTKISVFFVLMSLFMNAQIILRGTVVDEYNNPLPFVNVIIKGTTQGTTTDDEGRFAFKMKKNRGVLEVSFVGFQSQAIKVGRKTKYLNIVLKEGTDILEEVIVVTKPKKRLKKKENPAYRILKEIWKRKRKNGVELVKYYQFKKHKTIEIGLNNLDTAFIKDIFKDQYEQSKNEIQYDSDGINYYIPIYLSEQVSRIYGNNLSNKVREDIEAEKNEGIGAQSFVFDRMAMTFQNIDVFKNNITLLRKSFVSPLSTDGFATYDYVLYDSIKKNNQKYYNIYFFPIRDQDLAFKGNFWVADKAFTINKLRMQVVKGANLNFVRGLTFEKEFQVQNDSIYIPVRNAYEADFTFLDKNDANKGVTIKKTINYEDYILNRPMAENFYDIKNIKFRPDQYIKPEAYWQNEQKENNKDTYKFIANVKQTKEIRKITGFINTITGGFIDVRPLNIQFGPFWTTFANNEIEGLRARIGFRTFTTKDDRFRLLGHIAYGTKDKEFKYGLEAKYLLSYKPRITVNAAYQKEVEQLGSSLLNTSQLLGNTFGATALFSRGNNFFLSNVEKYAANFDYSFSNNFRMGLSLSRAVISSASPENFSISYNLNQANAGIAERVIDVASDFYISLTPGRFVYGLGVEQRFGRNIFPTIILNYRHGYKDVFNGTHDYDRIQIKYTQPIVLGKFGLLETSIEGGKTFGTVPVSLMNVIPANQSFSLVPNTFSLLNFYDFVTDTYVSSHFEHHFNGFILNRIPLVRDLKLRSLLTFRAVYGTVSEANKAINDGVVNSVGTQNIQYNAPNKIYYEYGFGFENIGYGNLRFLRIDAIWRSSYKAPINSIALPTPKFAIRLGIKPGL